METLLVGKGKEQKTGSNRTQTKNNPQNQTNKNHRANVSRVSSELRTTLHTLQSRDQKRTWRQLFRGLLRCGAWFGGLRFHRGFPGDCIGVTCSVGT